ncbi:MAG: helix-hairpin-helix domain-containing protein [Spirochaetota bacterium]|nr:helix-hairpin-helix domain-containing protein [Spirochaetota bacterium]
MTMIALSFILAKTLFLSFEYKTHPSSLFPYNNAVSESSAFGHLSNPAYLPIWKVTYISAIYEMPYSMEEMNSGDLRIGSAFNNIGLQLGWSRFGIEEYREDILNINLGYRVCRFLYSGIGMSYYSLYINTEELHFREGLTDFRASLLFLPFRWINVSYQQENINSIFNQERKDILYPDKCFGISIHPVLGISFAWNINKLYYNYINTFTLSTNLLSSLSIKAGYSREMSSFAAAIVFLYNLIRFSYGLRHHPYLGLTHSVGITLTSHNLPFNQVNYNKRIYRRSIPKTIKRVNVNNCTIDELRDIPLLTKEIAERIIKYRNIIGPVTRKALFQIGLTAGEVDKLDRYICGLAKKSERKTNEDDSKAIKYKRLQYKKRSHRPYNIETRKMLFQMLLESGISASTALRIAELSREKRREEIILEIENISDLLIEEKDLIIEICNDILY